MSLNLDAVDNMLEGQTEYVWGGMGLRKVTVALREITRDVMLSGGAEVVLSYLQ